MIYVCYVWYTFVEEGECEWYTYIYDWYPFVEERECEWCTHVLLLGIHLCERGGERYTLM